MPGLLYSLSFRAMGCQMGAWVVHEDPVLANLHLRRVQESFRMVERRFSRFLPESELSRLNARPGQHVRISPIFGEVLGKALEFAARTGGLFDPTVLTALEDAGYDRTFEAIQEDATPLTRGSPPSPSWRDIEVGTGTVSLPEGLRLDLGGIVKAWAARHAANLLSALGPCLVDAGGDLMALGSLPNQPGWPIGVADPRDPSRDLAVLWVRDRGVATSGLDFRRWKRGGVIHHHIIDPRTWQPAQTDVFTVTVVAEDVLEANLHALVTMILGARDGLRYLLNQKGVEALMVREDAQVLTTPGFATYVAYPNMGGFRG
ncbi:MAG: FAD:protein FMN transferase [Armatimonadota bacterium]|nr:FAD:protein FMN transferase [Armatimonadota bacterium]